MRQSSQDVTKRTVRQAILPGNKLEVIESDYNTLYNLQTRNGEANAQSMRTLKESGSQEAIKMNEDLRNVEDRSRLKPLKPSFDDQKSDEKSRYSSSLSPKKLSTKIVYPIPNLKNQKQNRVIMPKSLDVNDHRAKDESSKINNTD